MREKMIFFYIYMDFKFDRYVPNDSSDALKFFVKGGVAMVT